MVKKNILIIVPILLLILACNNYNNRYTVECVSEGKTLYTETTKLKQNIYLNEDGCWTIKKGSDFLFAAAPVKFVCCGVITLESKASNTVSEKP